MIWPRGCLITKISNKKRKTMDDKILDFNFPKETPTIIKVIGVGGGGGNAVTHMYKEGIT
jgi:cell division GTPase FtsZ